MTRDISGYTKLLFLITLVISFNATIPLWISNYFTLNILHSLSWFYQNGEMRMAVMLPHSNTDPCRRFWFLGLYENSLSNFDLRDHYWSEAISCSPLYIDLVKAKSPHNLVLAEISVQEHPDWADAWFWLAEINESEAPEQAVYLYWQGLQYQPRAQAAWYGLGNALRTLEPETALKIYEGLDFFVFEKNDRSRLNAETTFILASILTKNEPERAVDLYYDGLILNPQDGVRWYELGDLLAGNNPNAAIDAYLKSCYLGDPGNHGCYGAGWVAEQQGDFESAMRYYRLSHWDYALKRAAELE